MSTTLLRHGSITLDSKFIAAPDEFYSRLLTTITWEDRIRARRAASFGVPYNYSGIVWPEAPFPDDLIPVLHRVAEAVGFAPNNCLAHCYPDGTSTMGFHSDAADELIPGTGIAVVSLGAARVITFRKTKDRTVIERYLLPSGSLLSMTPEMQEYWQHAILADDGIQRGRISLTFRALKPD